MTGGYFRLAEGGELGAKLARLLAEIKNSDWYHGGKTDPRTLTEIVPQSEGAVTLPYAVHLTPNERYARIFAGSEMRDPGQVYKLTPKVSNPFPMTTTRFPPADASDILRQSLSENTDLRDRILSQAMKNSLTGENLAKWLAIDPAWEPGKGIAPSQLIRRSVRGGEGWPPISHSEWKRIQDRLSNLGFDSTYYKDSPRPDNPAYQLEPSLAVFDPKNLE